MKTRIGILATAVIAGLGLSGGSYRSSAAADPVPSVTAPPESFFGQILEIARAWIRRLSAATRPHDRCVLITVGLLPWSRQRKYLSGFVPEK